MTTVLRSIYGAKFGCAAILLCVTISACPAAAQESTAPAVTIIHAGKLFDAHAGRMLENQDIVIRGERIEKVGPNLAVPAGAREVDLRKATVLPGFIDVHTHLTMKAGAAGYDSLGVSTPRHALIGARNARVTLLAGFTTVRNVGAEGYADTALRDAIEDGDVIGPRTPSPSPRSAR